MTDQLKERLAQLQAEQNNEVATLREYEARIAAMREAALQRQGAIRELTRQVEQEVPPTQGQGE